MISVNFTRLISLEDKFPEIHKSQKSDFRSRLNSLGDKGGRIRTSRGKKKAPLERFFPCMTLIGIEHEL